MIILIKQYHQAVKNEKICPKPLGFTERRIMFLEPNEKDAHPKGRAFFFFFLISWDFSHRKVFLHFAFQKAHCIKTKNGESHHVQLQIQITTFILGLLPHHQRSSVILTDNK